MRNLTGPPSSINADDIISRLPNALMHHILSFMDMKYVVQTSVLSKRWIDVWTTISTLEFNSYEFFGSVDNRDSEIQIGSFANFINEVLILRGDSPIQKFHLDWHESRKASPHTIPIPEHMNTWIVAAVRRGLQDLLIHIHSSARSSMTTLRIPHCLLNSESLTKLVLRLPSDYTEISLPNSMSLPRLKFLSLTRFYVEEVTLLNELISSCPVLESLTLANIYVGIGDQVNLNIESRGLKHFYLHNKGHGVHHPRYSMTKVIKLSTPNLTSLVCHGNMIQEYFLENLPSLVTDKMKMTKENDRDCDYAHELKYLERSEEEIEELYPKRMMKMLKTLHNVGKLTVSASFIQRRIADVDDDWEARLSLPCTLSHLKFVKIESLQGCDNEFKFVEFLQKSGVVLEELVSWFRDFPRKTSSPEQAAIVKRFSKKLRAVPRASPNLKSTINVRITRWIDDEVK